MKLFQRLFFSLTLLLYTFSLACTNFIITKGATVDGSTFITYSADSHQLYGELYHWSAAKHKAGTMMDVIEWDTGKFLGKIKQANQTYNVVGNMNEFQVAITETTFGGREELINTKGIIDYGSLIYITLQRAKSAREAIKIMTDLVNEYGYYSSGESFSISDKNEAWIMEMIGKGEGQKGALWVAVKIPDGYISGHANQARITNFPLNDKENCLYADDVISFARDKGWFMGVDYEFSFSDTYAPLDFGAMRFCEARVWSGFNKVCGDMNQYLDYAMGKSSSKRMPLYVKPDRKLSLQDIYAMMRDYYQNTPMDMTQDYGAGPYGSIVRWRPLTWKVGKDEFFNERAISTQQTGFSLIAQSRSWLPDTVGAILWFGVDDTYSTVYTPMYASITQAPSSLKVGNGNIMTFSDTSAFWLFNQVSNFAYTRYRDMIVDIQKVQQDLEQQYIRKISECDAKALSYYKRSPEKAAEFLTEFSAKQSENTFTEWKKLYGFLFTKYMDGNVKTKTNDPMPKVEHPGYSDEFYRTIIEKTKSKFKMPENSSH